MEESKKKPVMIGVIAVCIVTAVLITYKTRSRSPQGIPDRFAKEMIWVKCRNPNCGHEWQISKKEYFKFIEEYRLENPGQVMIPGLKCPSCGEDEGFEAIKCEKCGLVFEIGLKRGDYEDRCPKCGYSKIEEERKKAAEGR